MGSLTAEQLADKLGTIKKKLSGAELIADDKVVKNFVDLNVPVNSEVLKKMKLNINIFRVTRYR